MSAQEGCHQKGAVPVHHRVMAKVIAVDGQDELAASGRHGGGRDGGNGWHRRAGSAGQGCHQRNRQHRCKNPSWCPCHRLAPPANWLTRSEVQGWVSRGSAGLAEPHNSSARYQIIRLTCKGKTLPCSAAVHFSRAYPHSGHDVFGSKPIPSEPSKIENFGLTESLTCRPARRNPF